MNESEQNAYCEQLCLELGITYNRETRAMFRAGFVVGMSQGVRPRVAMTVNKPPPVNMQLLAIPPTHVVVPKMATGQMVVAGIPAMPLGAREVWNAMIRASVDWKVGD